MWNQILKANNISKLRDYQQIAIQRTYLVSVFINRKKRESRARLITPEDFVTCPEQMRALRQTIVLEKNRISLPYFFEANALKIIAREARKPRELLLFHNIRAGLLVASGLSSKAIRHFSEFEKISAILRLIEGLEIAGHQFPEILQHKYLRAMNQNLKSRSSKLTTALAERKFLRGLISVLNLAGIKYLWKDIDSGLWIGRPPKDVRIEKRVKALYWNKDGKDRLLVKNSKLPLIDKSVDLMLFSGKPEDYLKNDRTLFLLNARCLALGELKGGIDPAGSDEHWKTANFALNRIRGSFSALGLNPPTFFVGAAIETSMAEEICAQMKARVLNKAANLTNDEQLTEICEWLMNL